MKRPVLALLWLRPGGVTVGDYAERGAVQRGPRAPMHDICATPEPHALPDVDLHSDDPHPPKRRADPDVWSTR